MANDADGFVSSSHMMSSRFVMINST
jgi:hypothetical protein